MIIRSLSLTDFRNYENLDFRPSGKLNFLVGLNGQGKSVILEAIYLLATSKSHRTSRDVDMVRIGRPWARVHAEVSREARNDVELEVVIHRSEPKTVKINTVKHARISDMVGQLNAVVFSSSDVDMVKGEPGRRRRFLNLEIGQISPRYVDALVRYRRSLEQRNNLLRSDGAVGLDPAALESWDMQIAAHGAVLVQKRREYVEFLSRAAAAVYADLSDESEDLQITYRSSIDIEDASDEDGIRSAFMRQLEDRRETDTARGITSIGPHRDDLLLTIGGIPAREFASQGQHRTAAIAMKLAEIELVEEAVGEPPVLLLDDVMGELDDVRRSRLLGFVSGRCQTILALTDLSSVKGSIEDSAAVFRVVDGTVAEA